MSSRGFFLVEVLVLMVVTGILLSVLFLGGITVLKATPQAHQERAALQLARGCMEWLLHQRRLQGYAALPCPSTPATAVCPSQPGYVISANVACQVYAGDASYKAIAVNVSGRASASLSMLIGEY